MKKILMVVMISVTLFLSGCASQNELQRAPSTKNGNNVQQNTNAAQNDPQVVQTTLTEGIDYIKIDQPIEDFTVWDFDGNEIQLSDYKGNVVFLYFWATWCRPCTEKMPMIQEFYEEQKEQGVVVLAISSTVVELRGGNDVEAARDQVKRFVEENGFTFPVVFDRYSEGWEIYQQRGIPVNYIIDREGIIRFFKPGSYLDKQQMIEFLRLAEQ